MKTSIITRLDLNLSDNQYIKGLENNPATGKFSGLDLPLDFKFNGDWLLRFSCACCGKEVSFGENHNIPDRYFHRMKPLTSDNYDLELLILLSGYVSDAEVIYHNDIKGHLITRASFPDKQHSILFLPVITLMYIQCKACAAEYLVKYRFGAGVWPEKDQPGGKSSEMIIDEIVYIDGDARLEDMILRS